MEENSETEFVQRMLKAYEDKDFLQDLRISDYKNFNNQVNRHASTLVLICILKLFDLLC